MPDSLTRQIPWLRIFVEGAVIVGSILLAFGLDAWWDRLQEAREERIILIDLERDFSASLQTLEERWIPLHVGALTATRDLIWRISRGDEPPPPPSETLSDTFIENLVLPAARGLDSGEARSILVSDSVVGASLLTATYDPTLSSLEALLESGSLSKVSNRDLRSLLAEFPAQLADVADEERLARDQVFTIVRPLVHRSMNAVAAELIGYFWLEASEPIPSPAVERTTELIASTELANVLSARFHTQSGVVSEIEGLRDEMQEILVLLEAELARADPDS
ncbi:MAG: hypothetical protein ACYTG5_19240 [Planctomycetota bacterium]|jgi:hypothetical protein